MEKTKTLSVRVDPQLITRIERFEKGTGIEKASLVRNSVEAALRYFEKHQHIRFPLELTPTPAPKSGSTGGEEGEQD